MVADALKDRVNQMRGIASKSDPNWMGNTIAAQKVLLENGYAIAPPLVFNPWPHWVTAKHIGGQLFGAPMPNFNTVLASSATVNFWQGYDKFPLACILQHLAPKLPDFDLGEADSASSKSSNTSGDMQPAFKDLKIPKLGAWATETDQDARKLLSKALKQHKDTAANPKVSEETRLDHVEKAYECYRQGLVLVNTLAPIASTLPERASLISDNRQIANNMRERAEQQIQDAARLDHNSSAQESLERRLARKLGQDESKLQFQMEASPKKPAAAERLSEAQRAELKAQLETCVYPNIMQDAPHMLLDRLVDFCTLAKEHAVVHVGSRMNRR